MATDLGILVSDTLVSFFPEIINVNFTAEMESDLDTVETGEKNWLDVLRSFYVTFSKVLDKSISEVKKEGKKKIYAEEPCPKCGKRLVLRWSKKGNMPFLSCEGYPDCDFAGSFEKVDETYHLKKEESEVQPVELEEFCPNCGSRLVIKKGRFGEFKACSAYPKCKTVIKEEKKICACPKCSGFISAKRSKKGRLFYGCSNYPTCDFVSWYPPIEGEVCPKCGAAYIIEKKKSGKVCQICGEKIK